MRFDNEKKYISFVFDEQNAPVGTKFYRDIRSTVIDLDSVDPETKETVRQYLLNNEGEEDYGLTITTASRTVYGVKIGDIYSHPFGFTAVVQGVNSRIPFG